MSRVDWEPISRRLGHLTHVDWECIRTWGPKSPQDRPKIVPRPPRWTQDHPEASDGREAEDRKGPVGLRSGYRLSAGARKSSKHIEVVRNGL